MVIIVTVVIEDTVVTVVTVLSVVELVTVGKYVHVRQDRSDPNRIIKLICFKLKKKCFNY